MLEQLLPEQVKEVREYSYAQKGIISSWSLPSNDQDRRGGKLYSSILKIQDSVLTISGHDAFFSFLESTQGQPVSTRSIWQLSESWCRGSKFNSGSANWILSLG